MNDELYEKVGQRYDVSPRVLKALVAVESSGGVDKRVRVEPHVRDVSIGPCQILTGTAAWLLNSNLMEQTPARERLEASYKASGGVPPIWRTLEDPEVSLELAAAYIRWQLSRYGDLLFAVAAYNAGSASLRGDGTFTNQQYVDKWYREYSKQGV